MHKEPVKVKDAFVSEQSQSSSSLDQRIRENFSTQGLDFVQWIFDSISVKPGDKVLELCSGTGVQSIPILNKIGTSGAMTATDISQESLETLKRKAGASDNLRVFRADLDDLESALEGHIEESSLDLIFCAYGLYYSKSSHRTLSTAKRWLKKDGRIGIVGPFGPNNHQLFSALSDCGVEISDYVRFTSQDFMTQALLPWASENFEKISIRTVINQTAWDSAEKIINYWKNSTFYNKDRLDAVGTWFGRHFSKNQSFINDKWIMAVEMTHGR